MSAPDKQPSSTVVVREVDPPLKDLSEKKQSFRRNVVSLAAELKEVRSRLASVYGQTRQKLHYVGHSLGTLMAFGAFSRHEVLSMVRSAALLSPIAYMGQMPSPLARASADRFLAEEAETKLKKMEREMAWLEKSLEERNTQLEASSSVAEMLWLWKGPSCLKLSNNKLCSFTALEPLKMVKSLQVLDVSHNEKIFVLFSS